LYSLAPLYLLLGFLYSPLIADRSTHFAFLYARWYTNMVQKAQLYLWSLTIRVWRYYFLRRIFNPAIYKGVSP